ncbi:MAG: DUF3597 domain-containing protein [Xanthobacteraceae bacterium]|nr:DUF3597 domain-containing protein [Xanthobacteraceae bacterium]
MSIFGNIMSKIFGHAKAATPTPGPAAPAPGSHAPGAAPAGGGAKPAAAGPATGGPATASTGPAGGPPVDVEAVLTHLAKQNHEKLDWRKSIVDLMKLLDLDSSLHARKELAKELHYSGDMNDSASMNVWLHKQVMTKLAENGGKVPDSLKA